MNCAAQIQIQSPNSTQIQGVLGDRLANCLAEAFSSRGWTATPMPVGPADDPNSAKGIIHELKLQAQAVVAANTCGDANQDGKLIVAFVLGGILDDRLAELYGLRDFGAQAGDALLSYIGVLPAYQGYSAPKLAGDRFEISPRTPGQSDEVSLSALLFKRWLSLTDVSSSPNVFIRTRWTIRPVLQLIEAHGFEYCGEFHLDFHGDRQERLVFRRSNT